MLLWSDPFRVQGGTLADRPVPEKATPHYGLDKLEDAISNCRIQITMPAQQGAWDADLDATDIPKCLGDLESADFYKSQQHEVPGHEAIWLDIYRPRYRERDLYVKFHEDTYGHPDRFIVRSFKLDESPHTKKQKEESS